MLICGEAIKIASMKNTIRLTACSMTFLTSCALWPGWHWEKPGASEADYALDVKTCKVSNPAPMDGSVTQQSVRGIHACLEGKGWRKVRE